jgi:hypothetical protein
VLVDTIDVLKGNGTEVAEADGVPLAFKMKTSS